MSSHQTADPDIVVLREGTEGLSMASYADALRERLPNQTVALARTLPRSANSYRRPAW